MSVTASAHKKLQCTVVSPERTLVDRPVDFVALPLYDGELGVLPGRAPLIGRLGYGELRIQSDGRTERYYVDGGFVQVRGDVVSVLTNRSVSAAEITPAAAEEELARALQQMPTTPEGFEAKQQALARARGKIRLSRPAAPSTASRE